MKNFNDTPNGTKEEIKLGILHCVNSLITMFGFLV